MINAASARAFGRLIVEMQPAAADSNEHVSGTDHDAVENYFTAEHLRVKADAFINHIQT